MLCNPNFNAPTSTEVISFTDPIYYDGIEVELETYASVTETTMPVE